MAQPMAGRPGLANAAGAPQQPRPGLNRPNLARPNGAGPQGSPRDIVPNLPVPVAPASPSVDEVDLDAPGGLGWFLNAIAKMLNPKVPPQPKVLQAESLIPAEVPVFTVAVAAVTGDTVDGAASQALYKALELKGALKVKPLPRPFQSPSLEDPAQVNAVITNTRHAVAEENADLLVWGELVREGYRLRLAGTQMADEDHSFFGPTTRIDLPITLDEAQLNLLFAAILAAAEPTTEVQRAAKRRLLPQAAAQLDALAAKPPISLAMIQQRSLQMIHGHVAATCAQLVPPSQVAEWARKAVASYRSAEKRLNARTDPPWEAGLIHKHVAQALTIQAERSKDGAAQVLEEAVKEWRMAAESLTRALMPHEWAMVQTKLGICLYRLDLLTGDSELLREALQSLQMSQQVYTRHENPTRWAEIMHIIAQVLEVYGDQVKSPEVLKRAIEACQSVLDMRSRERTPLAWAAVRNTQGSALFLLDKHSGGVANLAKATEILTEALDIFTAHRAKGPAQIAQRNLAHVQKLAEERKVRQIMDPDWA